MSKPMTRWRCPTHAMGSGRNRHTDTMGHYITLVVRTKGDPAAMAPAVENAIWQIDRNMTISEVQTMNAVVDRANAEARFNMELLAVFAVVA